MKKSIFKYIKMMFMLLLLLEGVVPHYHVLNSCNGGCSTADLNNVVSSQGATLDESHQIVVHGNSTLIKESDNIISLIIALACVVPIYYVLLACITKRVWSGIQNFKLSLYNYLLVVNIFFRPPPQLQFS